VMVVLDAELVGTEVLNAMLDLPQYRPWFQQIENVQDMTGPELDELHGKFRDHDFETGLTYESKTGNKENGIAVPRANFPPQFSVCDLPEPCGPKDSKWHYVQDLLQTNVLPKMQEVASRGNLPVILHIGSSDLASDQRFTDMDLHTRALATIPPHLRQLLRLVFVDANADYEQELLKRVRRLPIEPSQARFLNGMMTDECPSAHASMYRFTHQAADDFGVPWNIIRSWFGPTRDDPVGALAAWTLKVVPTLPTAPAAKWRAFDQAANRSSYVGEFRVPCLTVSMLLQRANVTARSMAMVVIDAERRDLEIVSSLLRFEGWRPGYLQYEQSAWALSAHSSIVRKLHIRGYSVGRSYGDSKSGSDANNVVAVLSQPTTDRGDGGLRL